MTCTHDCDQGRTCTCATPQDDIEDALFFHDLAQCLLIAAVLITLGMVIGVLLVKAGITA